MKIFQAIKNFLNRNKFLIYIGLMIVFSVSILYGLRISGKLMRETANSYLDKFDMEDIKIISSHGLDQEEIALLKETSNFDSINLSYQLDAQIEGSRALVSVESIPESWVKFDLREGEFPKESGEIAIDSSIPDLPYEIGDSIKLQVKGNNPSLNLKKTEFKIVGKISSPEFIMKSERGDSYQTGSKLDGFALISPEDFQMEAMNFARIHLSTTEGLSAFSTAYRTEVDNTSFYLREAFKTMPEKKAEKVKKLAEETIKKSEEESKKIKKEIADLDKSLEESKKSMDTERAKYDKEKKSFDDTLASYQKKIKNGEENKKKLEDSVKKITKENQDNTKAYNDFKKTFTELENKYNDKKSAISNEQSKIDQDKANANSNIATSTNKINSNNQTISIEQVALAGLKIKLRLLPINKASIEKQIRDKENYIANLKAENNKLSQSIQEANNVLAQADVRQSDLNPQLEELKKLEKSYNSDKKKLDDLKAKLDKTTKDLEKAKKDLATTIKEYEEAKKFFSTDKQKLEKTIEEAKKKLDKLVDDYEKKLNKSEERNKESKQELDDLAGAIERSKKELENKVLPVYTIEASSQNRGMKEYFNISKRVDMMTLILPLIFFAACLINISDNALSHLKQVQELDKKSYLTLGLVGLIFSLIGILIGQLLVSKLIFSLYSSAFIFQASIVKYYPYEILLILAFVMLSLLIPALIRCKKLDVDKDIPEIHLASKGYWNNLSDNGKTFLKALYTNRLKVISIILMIIASSSSLFLGLSLKRSVQSLTSTQFKNISHYDAKVFIDKSKGEKPVNDYDYFLTEIKKSRTVEEMSILKVSTQMEKLASIDLDMFVVENPEELPKIFSLYKAKSNTKLDLDDNGVLISSKLAKLNNLDPGDLISLDIQGNKYDFLIKDVFDNYLGHKIFISKSYYEDLIGKELDNNCKLISLKDSGKLAQENFITESGNYSVVQKVVTSRDEINDFYRLIKPLDLLGLAYVILSILLVVIAMSYVCVSYKNIVATSHVESKNKVKLSEKLLGQNYALVLFSLILGLLVGTGLFYYSASYLVPDTISYSKSLHWLDYVITISVAMISTIFINAILRGKDENRSESENSDEEVNKTEIEENQD